MWRWLKFILLSVATATVYLAGWMWANSAVLAVTDANWSLRELCQGIAAFGVAWLVRRYVKLWPLAVCCFAGALPVPAIWLYARTLPTWDDLTVYLHWALLQQFVIPGVMLPVAFLVLSHWPFKKVLQDEAPKARV